LYIWSKCKLQEHARKIFLIPIFIVCVIILEALIGWD